MTKKDVKFVWSEELSQAFGVLKEWAHETTSLRQPRWDVSFHVHVDASGYAIGIILAQLEGKMDYPVYYASRLMTPTESNYSTTEREALGMVYSIQNF